MKLKHLALLGICLMAIASVTRANDESFPDQDLSRHNFSGQSLKRANFSNAVLKYAQFINSILTNANFKGADLTGAAFFTDTDLTGADLRETVGLVAAGDLSKANLEGVTFSIGYRVKFRNANMKKCNFVGVIGACDFSGADLRGATLRGARFDATDRFRNAIYDEDTSWPDGFDFKAAGAVLGAPDAPKP